MTSLFTNVPFSETIKLAVDLFKTSQSDLNISKKYLTSLFNFAACETLYQRYILLPYQADGATMGSSLGPILANIFIDYHKKEWLNNYDGISLSTLCTMSI